MRNSFGRASVGRIRDDDVVHGRETVGNSMGRAPWGRSNTEATIGWTDGKPWEIVWGEVRGEGARWKLREGGQGGKPW